jgi:hypothetical protein
MAVTKRTDLIYVDQLQEAIQGAFAGKRALFGTGAAMFRTNLPSIGPEGTKLKGGDTIRVPYFDTIGELDDVSEGTGLVPVKLTETSETATVVHSGKMGEVTDWAQLTAQFADPYAEFGRQFSEAWMRRIDKGLIDKALTTTLTNDISTIGNGLFSIDAVYDSVNKWQDEQDDIVLMVMHSSVMNDARKLKSSTGNYLVQDPVNSGDLPKVGGIPTKVSNRMVPVSGVYPTALCKRGALAAWANGTPETMEDRDISVGSLLTAIHTYHVEHLYKRPANGTLPGVVLLKTRASS